MHNTILVNICYIDYTYNAWSDYPKCPASQSQLLLIQSDNPNNLSWTSFVNLAPLSFMSRLKLASPLPDLTQIGNSIYVKL